MITNAFFPVLSPDAADHANGLIASQAWSSRVGVPLDLGVASGSDLRPCSALVDGVVDLPLGRIAPSAVTLLIFPGTSSSSVAA